MKLTSLIVAACLLFAVACNKHATTASPTPAAGTTSGTKGAKAAPLVKQGISKLTALSIKDVKVGDGLLQGVKVGNQKPVAAGDLISIEYTGKLQDGTMFDTNLPGSKLNGLTNTHANPLTFYVGRQMVVPGLDQGVVGMTIGGERNIGIPPALGYGDQESGPIPAHSDLLFNVKLLDVVKPGEEGYFDSKDVSPGKGAPVKKGDTIRIEYTEKLADGSVVESNVGKEPVEFTIGQVPATVISGLEQGVIGMKNGGVRILRVPPAIGYGTKMVPGIPANSTLIIQVKIVGVM